MPFSKIFTLLIFFGPKKKERVQSSSERLLQLSFSYKNYIPMLLLFCNVAKNCCLKLLLVNSLKEVLLVKD